MHIIPPPLLMEKQPLLPYSSPPSTTFTPSSKFKDYLIFGPPIPPPPPPFSHNVPILDPLNLQITNDINNSGPNSVFAPPNSPFASSSQNFQEKSNLDQYLVYPNSPFVSSSSNFQEKSNLEQWLLDPNCKSSKKCLHRSKTAPALNVLDEVETPTGEKGGGMNNSQPIVKQAIVLLMLYLTLGVVIYSCYRDHFNASETHPVVDALYFCIVTMCTIGYGDITPATTTTKLFAIFFVLIGFGFIDILLSGMVSYVLDLQESYLLRTMNNSHGTGEKGRFLVDVKKGRMRIRMKVGLALGVVVVCIGMGVAFLHFVERLDWLDSFYLSVMSVTTVGYGDRAFSSMYGRIFASIWLLVSTLAVARAFLFLAEARVDKRHRKLAKLVLRQDMTVAQFLAADLDHNGCVSKAEFVIYKLKEMGKVAEKDIQLICKQFERLDEGNCGKITLTDLTEPRRSHSLHKPLEQGHH